MLSVLSRITISSFLIITSLFSFGTVWAADPVLSLQLSKTTVTIGEEFTVAINIDTKDRTVAAADIIIKFPASLQAKSIVAGSYLPVVLVTGSITSTTASIVLGASPTDPKKGTGVLATITMKVLSNPGSSIQISFDSATQIGAIGVDTSSVGSMNPATVTVSGTITSPSPTPTPTRTPTPTPSITPTPTPTPLTRLKLVKTASSPKVYYITEKNFKRWIPTAEIFLSYGNRWQDIVIIPQSQLDTIPDNILIKLPTSPKTYKLENNTKRWITTADAFNRNGFSWNQIAPVNQTELDYYQTGANIQ